MEKLICAGGPCQAYCQALAAHGVNVGLNPDCAVPAMFSVGDTPQTIQFTPESASGEAFSNPKLVEELGGAVAKTLIESQATQPEMAATAELITAYEAEFSARRQIWHGMIKATHAGRPFTDTELGFFQAEVAEQTRRADEQAKQALPNVHRQAQAGFDQRQLTEHGLLFDDQILGVVDRLTGNLMLGKPTLLVGDKGLAKTQIARFVAGMSEELRHPGAIAPEPIMISGHGDMMSNELIGQVSQDKNSGMFVFKEGKLVDAMRDGRPVILDEVNVGDQAVMMRLQDILLRRPGQKITLQENGDNAITIKPGFVVFATANEASARYQHRSQLDPAFRDRYDVVRLDYPDSNNRNPLHEIPQVLLRLAIAAAVDQQGRVSPHIDLTDVERLARLAHVTQHLYTIPAADARVDSLVSGSATANAISTEPIMTDCITPRVVHDTIRKCKAGNLPGVSLADEIKHLITKLDQAGGDHNKMYAQEALRILTSS